MASIARDTAPDSSLAFFREGYEFIGNRCRRFGTDLFRTRIMLRPVICMQGEEAARRFYDGRHFTRVGAMPQTTLRLLQDKGSVQLLDGEAHQSRKAMFMAMMAPDSLRSMGDTVERRWRQMIDGRAKGRHLVLHDEMVNVLSAAACDWAGIPVADDELRRRAREFAAMIDGAGAIGPRNWRGMLLRRRTERWARGLVEDVRAGRLHPDRASPLAQIARYRGLDGQLLDLRSAGVELLNLLRPIVAVGRFVVFAALALHEHPDCRKSLESGDEAVANFVQEVRRFYPFFPVIGGRVREAFDWREHRFGEGVWVLLGLHATNHDPRLWPEPRRFRPERFLGWKSSGYDLIPQGAGDYDRDHRCPGEWLTIEIMTRMTKLLLQTDYRVPPQDLRVPLNRFPTLPKSGFILQPSS